MAFDISTAKPIDQPTENKGFDISTAKPIDQQLVQAQSSQAGNLAPAPWVDEFNRLFDAGKLDEAKALANQHGPISFDKKSTLQQGSLANDLTQGFVDTSAGLLKGAINVGTAIPDYIDQPKKGLSDLVNPDQKTIHQKRMEEVDRFNAQVLGANKSSPYVTGGEITSELAGSGGVGKILGAASKAVPLVKNIPWLEKSLVSGGLDTSGAKTLGSKALSMGTGGAVTGAAQTAIIDPENSGTGAIIGGSVPYLGKVIGAAYKTIKKVFSSSNAMANNAAGEYLKEHLIRGGMSEADAITSISNLGPDALLADASPTLQSLLGTVGRQSPAVAGKTVGQLSERAAQRGERTKGSVIDAFGSGDTLPSDVISKLKEENGPAISQLYKDAADEMAKPIPELDNLMAGDGPAGWVQDKVEKQLKIKAAGGQELTPFDRINATKQAMDGDISELYRAGRDKDARDLVMAKNKFLQVADDNIPSFRQARNLYAGQAALEDAAKNGEMILKMPASDVQEFVNGLSKSEKAMYVLGAKKAIFNKIDDTITGADAFRRIFGKNGDSQKMRALFPDDETFKAVEDSMRREATFLRTEGEFKGSMTAQRMQTDASNGIPTSVNEISSRAILSLGKKRRTEADKLALQKVGDLLTKKNLTLEELTAFINTAEKKKPMGKLQKSLPSVYILGSDKINRGLNDEQ